MPYKDIEKRRAASRESAARHRDKRRAYYKEYIAKPENREKKNKHMSEYESRQDVADRKKERAKADYIRNRSATLQRQQKRREERLLVMSEIAESYSCQNPKCAWDKPLESFQLDFHHFDPSQKVIEVAKMESWSYSRIEEEINKCIVLCKNCHAEVHRRKVPLDETMLCKVSISEEVINEGRGKSEANLVVRMKLQDKTKTLRHFRRRTTGESVRCLLERHLEK